MYLISNPAIQLKLKYCDLQKALHLQLVVKLPFLNGRFLMDGGLSRTDPDLPCVFIIAPRLTPGSATKCPASCHCCPLPLYLPNLFLLPALPSFPLHSLLPLLVLEETQMPFLPPTQINVMYCWSQEEPVLFFLPRIYHVHNQCLPPAACFWLSSISYNYPVSGSLFLKTLLEKA